MAIAITKKNTLTNHLMDITLRSKESLARCNVCNVCEAPAKHSNFGIICCSPCKMFFKRNAELGQEHFICSFGDQCDVDMKNRRICSSCRLTKCFTRGMKVELLRGSRTTKNRKRSKKQIIITSDTSGVNDQSQQLFTSNLLQSNHTILTIDEWNNLVNIFDYFDEQKQFSLVEQFLSEQNSLPLKLRFKCGPVRDLISCLLTKTQLLFENNREFLSLCSHDRSILLQRLMKYVAMIVFSFIAEQTHLIDYSSFYQILQSLFIQTSMSTNKHPFTLLDNFDVRSLKLALAIICFSTFDYIIYDNHSAKNLVDVKRIMNIQHMYIELTWRYLVHEYNEYQAVMYFSNLIKYIFVVHENVISMQEEKSFMDIINSTIEQTEEALTMSM